MKRVFWAKVLDEPRPCYIVRVPISEAAVFDLGLRLWNTAREISKSQAAAGVGDARLVARVIYRDELSSRFILTSAWR